MKKTLSALSITLLLLALHLGIGTSIASPAAATGGDTADLPQATQPATGTAQPPRIPVENAPAPLYDDPVWHGAADPAVVWMPGKGAKGEYWMYYTQRRSTLPNDKTIDGSLGVAIGIATSPDGIHWKYLAVCKSALTEKGDTKPLAEPGENNSWWAPTVFWGKGTGISGGGQPGDKLHMFVTYVHGISPKGGRERTIEHFTSDDGLHWSHISSLPLASRFVIDPTVYNINNTWYLWYNNEAVGARTFCAKSQDLATWQDLGDAKIGSGHEAPFVWRWKGAFWDLQDRGPSLDAWRSDTGLDNWIFNTFLLPKSPDNKRPFDIRPGHHPWILLQDPASGPVAPDDKQLVLFYFTMDGKKCYMQMAEMTLTPDGKLACDRNRYLPKPLTSAPSK